MEAKTLPKYDSMPQNSTNSKNYLASSTLEEFSHGGLPRVFNGLCKESGK
jgi:hypothetical protein